MAYTIVRSNEEIDEVLNKAAEAFDEGSKFPGQKYEEGIDSFWRWLIGDSEDNPMEE